MKIKGEKKKKRQRRRKREEKQKQQKSHTAKWPSKREHEIRVHDHAHHTLDKPNRLHRPKRIQSMDRKLFSHFVFVVLVIFVFNFVSFGGGDTTIFQMSFRFFNVRIEINWISSSKPLVLSVSGVRRTKTTYNWRTIYSLICDTRKIHAVTSTFNRSCDDRARRPFVVSVHTLRPIISCVLRRWRQLHRSLRSRSARVQRIILVICILQIIANNFLFHYYFHHCPRDRHSACDDQTSFLCFSFNGILFYCRLIVVTGWI